MFLYFVPGPFSRIPTELEYAFDSASAFTRIETMQGPCGAGNGSLIAHPTTPATRCKLVLNEQTWRRIPKTDFYCGRWNDVNGSPAALQRPEMIDGHPVELENGSRWQCAIARGFDPDQRRYFTTIPSSLTLDDEGRWLPSLYAPKYRRFMNLALAYAAEHDKAVDEDRPKFDFPDIDELAILGLTCNYRVSSIELALMGEAYSIRVRDELLASILDFPTIREWSKKKAAEGLAGSPI